MTLQRGQLTDRRPPFKYSAHTRVDFSDTDAQGVVYYGRYLPYFDMARVEYLRHLGLLDVAPKEEELVARALSVEYLAPARFDDALEIFVRLARIGHSSTRWEFAAYRVSDDELMVTSSQTMVLIDIERRRPAAVPASFRATVQAFEGADLELPGHA
ncbi:MAG: acyl-CoA thioester hydrolase [Gaiellaceae bacterium]|nr:acyl-CoA thioester hydrolase [Gaiellaceae bacterium]